MKLKFILIMVLILCMFPMFGCVTCEQGDDLKGGNDIIADADGDENTSGDDDQPNSGDGANVDENVDTEDKSQFLYTNDGAIEGADPSVITVGDSYYAYMTNANKDGDCSYFKVYKSKNLKVWEDLGVCFVPARDAWSVFYLWAPEVIEKDGKFYMYYSGMNATTAQMGLGVAIADKPEGPFKEVDGVIDGKTYSRQVCPITFGFKAIDACPFIDDNGDVYLYAAKDQVDGVSSIWVVKMKPNMVEMDGTPKQLISPDVSWELKSDNGKWNEGPYVIKRNGTYYLFYSANYYETPDYAIGIATSSSPTGPFTKVNYNPILSVQEQWLYVSGPGHNSVFPSVDGKELFMAYHTHVDTSTGGGIRQLCFDRIVFDENDRMIINGPSITPQLVPSGSSEYGNITLDAEIVMEGSSANKALLTDGIINYIESLAGTYEINADEEIEITFTFSSDRTIRAIMIYDSCLPEMKAESVKISINGGKASTLTFNKYYDEYENEIDQPGSCGIKEYTDKTANEITITIPQGVAISEIIIVGK